MFLAISEGPALLIAAFAVALVAARASHRERRFRVRADLVRRALDSGALDDETKRQLVLAVAKRQRFSAGEVMIIVGWIALFAGIGLLILGMTTNARTLEQGVMLSAVSLAVLSLPLALRELAWRRDAIQTSSQQR